MEASQTARHRTASPKGSEMFEIEFHKMRAAQLQLAAQEARMANEAARAACHTESRRQGCAVADSHSRRPRWRRLLRTV